MKKKIQSFLSLISFTAIGMSSMAWADAPSLADGNQAIVAETNVTRDAIDQMLRRMADQSANVEFNARDFRSKSVRFQADVARLMQGFENQLKDSILRKLNYWAQRYDAIYHSQTLTPGQKQQLLAQQLQVIRGQEQLIEREYQTAIKGLYQAVGDVPLQINYRVVSDPGRRDRRRHDCARDTDGYIEFSMTTPQSGVSVTESVCDLPDDRAAGWYGRSNDSDHEDHFQVYEDDGQWVIYQRSAQGGRYAARPIAGSPNWQEIKSLSSAEGLNWLTAGVHVLNKTRLYQELYYPVVSQGCSSQICLALSASQMTTYLGLVQTSIDREIKVTLADGATQLTLRPTAMDLGAALALIADIGYPASAQALPFDTE